MKCHLCKSELMQHSGPLWEVGGRKQVQFSCRNTGCKLIKVQHRSEYEIILPDEDIVSYNLLIPSNEKWYRVWARKNSEYSDDTALYSVDVNPIHSPSGENLIINVPRFYPLYLIDDLKDKSQELIRKFKNLVIFS